jgi:hypothetical protein
MPFQKGVKPDGSGRKKGSLNKRTVERQETFDKIVEKHGDPLEALAEMAFDPNNPLDVRKDCMKDVVQYGYAKKKAVEISGPDGGPVEVKLELIEQITGLIEKLNSK